MARPNLTLAALDEMTAEEIAALNVHVLVRLHDEAVAAAKELKRRSDALLAGIDLKYGGKAAFARRRDGKDAGIVRVEDAGVTVIQDIRRLVDWDQHVLADIDARMRAAGDDPLVYMRIERRVAETSYKDWPEAVRKAFEAARTVRVSKPSYRFEGKSK